MSIYFNIERALIESVLSQGLLYDIEYSGAPLDIDNRSDIWLSLHDLRVGTYPVTIGDNGEDEYLGIFQIDINTKLNNGIGDLLNIADTLKTFYKSGKVLTFNGTKVIIKYSSLSSERINANIISISLDINYYARKNR